MDGQTNRPKPIAPSTSSKLGTLHCINVQVMSLTSSIYDHFSRTILNIKIMVGLC